MPLIRKNKVLAEIKHGPPQDDNPKGLYMDLPKLVEAGDFVVDSLGRDKFSTGERIAQWEDTMDKFNDYKESPIMFNRDDVGLHLPDYGIWMLGAPMGYGKTLWSTHIARIYAEHGWLNYSTAGLLFGQRLTVLQSYAFPDFVTPGSFLFADEVHTLADRYANNSVRMRTLGQSMTAMRKEQVGLDGASADPDQVSWEYKRNVEWVMVPKRWYLPDKSDYKAPPFCYIEIVMRGPYPYRKRDLLIDQMLGIEFESIREKRFYPDPQEMLKSAKLMDSFESVRLGENFDANSQAMKDQREEVDAGAPEISDEQLVFKMLHGLYEGGHLNLNLPKIPFTSMNNMVGLQRFSRDRWKGALSNLQPTEGMIMDNAIRCAPTIEWLGRTKKIYLDVIEGRVKWEDLW